MWRPLQWGDLHIEKTAPLRRGIFFAAGRAKGLLVVGSMNILPTEAGLTIGNVLEDWSYHALVGQGRRAELVGHPGKASEPKSVSASFT